MLRVIPGSVLRGLYSTTCCGLNQGQQHTRQVPLSLDPFSSPRQDLFEALNLIQRYVGIWESFLGFQKVCGQILTNSLCKFLKIDSLYLYHVL